MTNLRELNSQFDALGMTNIRVAVITRGEHKGKFAIIQIIPNGQPKQMYMSNSLENCINFVKEKFKMSSKVNQRDVKDTRTANLWLKQNGLGNMLKVASELKGNRRVYTVYSLDPRYKNKELYKGTLNHCVDFIKSQTGIKENIIFTNLKSNMRHVDNKQPIQNNVFIGNTQVKQPIQTQNKVSMIRNVDDANRWLQSIGADKKYRFNVFTENNASKYEKDYWIQKRGIVYFTEDNPERFTGRNYHRSLYLMVQIAAQKMRKPMPPCIDDRGEKVVDIPSANRWLRRIGENKDLFRVKKDAFGRTRYAWDTLSQTGVPELDEIHFKHKSLEDLIRYYCDFNGEPLPYM